MATSGRVHAQHLHLREVDRNFTCSWNANANENVRCDPTFMVCDNTQIIQQTLMLRMNGAMETEAAVATHRCN